MVPRRNSFQRNAAEQINEMLHNPPSSWQRMFKDNGVSAAPTIEELIDVLLEKTAGGNDPGDKGEDIGDIPQAVREEALKGVVLSYEANYPSYNGIGLARAIQLATQETLPIREVRRMCAFFRRNQRYRDYPCFGDDEQRCKSYLAWLNWGGDAGFDWACELTS